MVIQESLTTIIQTIIGGALSIASVYLPIYISKLTQVAKNKAALLKHEEAKNIISNTIERVDDLIVTNIISIENTLKPQILEAIKDGKVDKSELETLSTVVKENVIKQLGQDANDILNTTLTDTNNYLTNRIERILAELKDTESNVVSYTKV